MPSEKTVQECIDEDVVLQIAMARDIVNNKGLARWLIEEHGLEGTEDNIAQALNRMEAPGPSESLQRALNDLRDIEMNTERGIDVLVIPRSAENLDRIIRFARQCNPEEGDSIHVLTEEKTFTVVFPSRYRAEAEERFEDSPIEHATHDLVDVQFIPKEGDEITGQAIGVALDLLYLALIDVPVVFGGPRGHHFLVHAGTQTKTIHVLTKYVQG